MTNHRIAMKRNVGNQNIGISLSGGGIRASIFHLGVLKWLAENGELENIRHISSVSGASLAVGLIYARSGYHWPDSQLFLNKTLPKIRNTILNQNIQQDSILSLLGKPWKWNQKVNVLAHIIEKKWGVHGLICDLPSSPLWSINCTSFETGNNFRINQKQMGDYKIGYVSHPKISISDAISASAGFPVLIGAYKLSLNSYQWTTPLSKSGRCNNSLYRPTLEDLKILHLWDGGVYDNLGLEALYKISNGGHLTEGLDFLIVSNASSPCPYRKWDNLFSVRNLSQLLDINMNQVVSLRSRDVIDYFLRTQKGYYVQIGSKMKHILAYSSNSLPCIQNSKIPLLKNEEIDYVKYYPTTLTSPTEADYDLILNHGYETAKYTELCYYRPLHNQINI
ncbi:MAG: patatin-like phospholipase family protein [Anaerovorax sp.]|nr:patatin-like phospholipase family protein [Anaerovorax sp.]